MKVDYFSKLEMPSTSKTHIKMDLEVLDILKVRVFIWETFYLTHFFRSKALSLTHTHIHTHKQTQLHTHIHINLSLSSTLTEHLGV